MRGTCKSVSLPATTPNWWDEMEKTGEETGREVNRGGEGRKQTLQIDRGGGKKKKKSD